MLTIVKKKKSLTPICLRSLSVTESIKLCLLMQQIKSMQFSESHSFVFENTKHTVVFNLLCSIQQVILSQIYMVGFSLEIYKYMKSQFNQAQSEIVLRSIFSAF